MKIICRAWKYLDQPATASDVIGAMVVVAFIAYMIGKTSG